MDLVHEVAVQADEQDMGKILDGDETRQSSVGVYQGHGADAMLAQSPAN